MNNEIVIKLSKDKIYSDIIFWSLFGLSCFWVVTGPQTSFRSFYGRPIGIILIMFCGFYVVYLITKLFHNKSGLIISKTALFDNSIGLNGGLIKWSDIKGIETTKDLGMRLILIFVYNPKDYLEKANILKRLCMNMTNDRYGTPLIISSKSWNVTLRNYMR